MAIINPYLTFQGNAQEAFMFYKSVFGNEFAMMSKFKDMPPDENMPVSESDKEKILHVALPIGKGNQLMGSDTLKTMNQKFVVGTNFSISIQAESKEEADKLFNGLAEGGTVTMPIQDMFWGAYFGMLTDKFGIQWMVNYEYPEQK